MVPILPGSTIGILGGGQLGRMLAIAAAQLGYRCHVYAPPGDNVAAEVCVEATEAAWDDEAALTRFAAGCDVVTYEFENVPVEPLGLLPADKLAPGLAALEIAQDRLREKDFVEGMGGRPAPYCPVDDHDDLRVALNAIGLPGILKTRREGYDGKGQWRLITPDDVAALDLSAGGFVYEGLVRFAAEFSVILVRGRDGEVRFWDSTQNVHQGGILATSTLPPGPLVAGQVDRARDLALQVAKALDYVGVLTCEFFAGADGPVFNEMAPRVHNSGHWTIEGAVTCQFANHIRAICGLPLGDTTTRVLPVTMRNLLGDDVADPVALLADGAAQLHLYGKGDARDGRKMGHVTRIG
ncbi:5-(carboxyamino)imidazole ribonucleotide synthase [Croceibacterium ferulae]|uniref:5-(carboxyamino)imidazole ribonucleotide synthase n=1 Tax=Croceibacterium ferulae TaxID=1854641 RepID=UPI000EB20877|nr:5-(carboxyamino)imidazole ribonucleotide synthase [Croceibacterium ferulae]